MLDEQDRPPYEPLFGVYSGEIVAIDDPVGLGRVRVRVPGLLEPRSEWAWPFGMPGSGRKRGLYKVPPIGSEVVVMFLMGNPDRPLWAPGPRGAPGGSAETPDAALEALAENPADADKITVFETDTFLIVIDDRATSAKMKLVHKATGDGFDYDGLTMQLTLKGTVGVSITSTGPVSIDGLTVTIGGRLVVPGAGPIR